MDRAELIRRVLRRIEAALSSLGMGGRIEHRSELEGPFWQMDVWPRPGELLAEAEVAVVGVGAAAG